MRVKVAGLSPTGGNCFFGVMRLSRYMIEDMACTFCNDGFLIPSTWLDRTGGINEKVLLAS